MVSNLFRSFLVLLGLVNREYTGPEPGVFTVRLEVDTHDYKGRD